MEKHAFRIPEFCESHGLSRATFYTLVKIGDGPALFRVGRRVLISKEAATAWVKKMESRSAA